MAAPIKKMALRSNRVISLLYKTKCAPNRKFSCLTNTLNKTHDNPFRGCSVSKHFSSANATCMERNPSRQHCQQSQLGLLFSHQHYLPVNVSYSTLAERECWKCGRKNGIEEERFFCKCGIIQEIPDDITYFDVLGMEKIFDLNLAELREHFMQHQRRLHPDKYSQKTEEEQQLADQQSSLLNIAYYTLLKPLSRGLYLLVQHGEGLEEGTVKMDNEFLMEIMELNEQIVEANTKETVIQLGEDNELMLQKMERKLSDAFKANNILYAKEILQEMKYYDNLDQKIKELEREQGIIF